LKKQIKLGVSNFVNPWFLNKLAQCNYNFNNQGDNVISAYRSIYSRVNNLKSFNFTKPVTTPLNYRTVPLRKKEHFTSLRFPNRNIKGVFLSFFKKLTPKKEVVNPVERLIALPKAGYNIFL